MCPFMPPSISIQYFDFYFVVDTLGAKLLEITYCYSAKQFYHYSKLLITIVNFGGFLLCKVKLTLGLKELLSTVFAWQKRLKRTKEFIEIMNSNLSSFWDHICV